jgi:hypothetical protein
MRTTKESRPSHFMRIGVIARRAMLFVLNDRRDEERNITRSRFMIF